MNNDLLDELDIYLTIHFVEYLKFISRNEGWNYIDLLQYVFSP